MEEVEQEEGKPGIVPRGMWSRGGKREETDGGKARLLPRILTFIKGFQWTRQES